MAPLLRLLSRAAQVAALAAALAAVPSSCGGVDARSASAPTSVLVVCIDGLRADNVGAYGYARPTTMHLDRFSGGARRFVDAVTPAPWSAPAIAALFTGRYPSRTGLTDLDRPWSERAITLAELLADAGYYTAAVVSHPLVARGFGLEQGFERFDEVGEATLEAGVSARRPSAALVTDRALDVLERSSTRPFLLFAHYADPMPDWVVRSPFGDPAYDGPVREGESFERILRRRSELSDADVEEIIAHYDAEIAYTDREVGRLLAALDASRWAERTLVVVTSTHGMEFLEHGELGDAKTLYDELIHVPLWMRGSEIVVGEETGAVSLIDVLPTLLERLGLPEPPTLDGIDLFAQDPLPARELFSETNRARTLRAVVSGSWKLIEDLETGERELYDLATDPSERLDRAQSEKSRTRLLEASLERWEAEREGAQ